MRWLRDKRAPKRTKRLTRVNAGSPKGREPQGDGTPIVVRARERRVHGEGATLEGGLELSTDKGKQGR